MQTKILVVSDLHFSAYSRWGDFDKLTVAARAEKPDLIVIPGDIINSILDFYIKGVAEKAREVLTKLGEMAEVLAVVGNHEYVWSTRGHDTKMYRDEKMFAMLETVPNMRLLQNEWYEVGGLRFYGMEMDEKYYYPKEDKARLMEELKKLKMDPEKMNVLIFHAPEMLFELEAGFDLTISGHMHEGLVPGWMRKFWRQGGIVGPYGKLFPKHVVSEGKHVIAPAWEAIPVRPWYRRMLRPLFREKFLMLYVDPVEKSCNIVEKIAKK